MAADTADVLIASVFVSLESFLQKTASLDLFDGLLFDYKMKNDENSPAVIREFLNVIQTFTQQLQEIHQKYAMDKECKVAVETIQLSITDKEIAENLEESSSKSKPILTDPMKGTVINDQLEHSIAISIPEQIKGTSVVEEEVLLNKQMKTRKRRSFTQTSSSEQATPKKSRYETRGPKGTKLAAEVNNWCCEWQCMLCSRVFSKRARLTTHMIKVHNQEVGAGEECPASTHQECSGDEEEDIELDKASLNVYCCGDCFAVYKTLSDLTEHECQSRDDIEEIDHPPREGIDRLLRSWDQLRNLKSLVCGQCYEEYRSLRRMTHHLPKCQSGPYACELCGIAFPNKRELNYHKKKQHSEEKSFFCEDCGLSFKLRTSLQKHLVHRHENAQNCHVCVDCGLTFNKRIHLTNHRAKVHELEKNFLCQICGNKFCTQGSLSAHLETHSQQPKFTCSYCPMSFHRKEKFIFHTRIHTGERPFQCTTCTKSFIRKTKLDEHMRRHRGEKPFACQHCSKKYAAAWDLKHHISKHHLKETKQEEKDDSSNSQSENTEMKVDVSKLTQVIEVLPHMTQDNNLPVCTIVPERDPNILPVVQRRSIPPCEIQDSVLSNVVQDNKRTTLPTILPSKLEMIEVVSPTPDTAIIGVESLQLSTLETVPGTQFIQLPASSQIQIQVPISVGQSFDLNSHQGQQILLTSLANFDVTAVSNLQF